MMVTKRTGADAKRAKSVTKTGRSPVGERPMSDAERQRRRRARKRQAAKPVKDANEIFEALCESRNLTSAFDRRLAESITDSLCSGNLTEAVRGMALLPAIQRPEGAPTMTASDAKARFLQQFMNVVAASRIELDLDFDGSENDALRRKVAALQAELAALRSAPAAPATARAAEPAKSPDMSNVTPLRPEPKAEPKASAEPVTPLPEPTQSWDSTPNAAAWRAWRANNPDGYGGGGVV
jgi:hypothetical protein